MRILITGVTGFVGSHLAEFLIGHTPHEIWGVRRVRSCLDNIEHLANTPLHLITGDLTDPSSVRHILETARPHWVFHLAAQSFVGLSFTQPRETLNTNIACELNLLHGLREGLFQRLMVAGSSEEYGLVNPDEIPITEDQPLRPLSPYGVSKVAQDLLAYQYHQSYGVHVIRTRAFNHEGPRRGEQFVTSAFAKQIAQMEFSKDDPMIYVGNLDAVRDYTDVRDVVRAYWLLMDQGRAGDVYNICSGIPWTIRGVLDYLISQSVIREKIRVIPSPTLMRPSDVPRLIGSAEKMRKLTGWEPAIPFQQTLTDILVHWRVRVKKNLDNLGVPG